MQKEELRQLILSHITEAERESLAHGDASLRIGGLNREMLLRLRDAGEVADGDVADDHVEGLCGALKDYLEHYMANCPEGHKWISSRVFIWPAWRLSLCAPKIWCAG